MSMVSQKWLWYSVIVGVVAVASCASAAEDPATAPAPAPAAAAPAAGLSPLPSLAPLDGGTAQAPPATQPQGGLAPLPPAGEAVGTPPPLPSLGSVTEEASETTTAVAGAPAGPIELYEFLFVAHDEYGVLREKMSVEEAKKIKDKEIASLAQKYGNPQAGAQQQQGADPRAFASWDFYFQQLELYGRYVKEQLLPNASEDLPDPDFNVSSQEAVVANRKDLKTAYDKAAQEEVNRQRDENLEFYERLQRREDVRKKYLEWLAQQDQDLTRWATAWGRRANASRWVAAEGKFSRDDWYYGTNFGVGQPLEVQIGGQQFVYSAEPVSDVSEAQVNILTQHVSPYDIVGPDGEIRTRESELQRGTLVEPPLEEDKAKSPGLIEVTQ